MMRTGVEKLSTDTKTLDQTILAGRDSVSDALTYLTSSKVQNFYARIINLMDRVAIPGFGTMAVSVYHGHYIFLYDPVFASTTSYEELCATCEHEVLHLILEHIPRALRFRELYVHSKDVALVNMTSNLAVDLAVNELLARTWPKIKDKTQPLGFWVIPEQFDPPFPKDLSYENYQQLLLDYMHSKLKTPPENLKKLVQHHLNMSEQALKQALKILNKKNDESDGADKPESKGEPSPGEGQGQGQGEGQGEGQGQGEGTGQSEGQGQGQGEGTGQSEGTRQSQGESSEQPSKGMTPEEYAAACDALDPVDNKLLEMLIKASRPHLSWDVDSKSDQSTNEYKLSEHGKLLLKAALTESTKSRGTVPGHILEIIKQLLLPPTVSWVQFLHNIVQRTRQTRKERGMSRPSKKLAALKVFASAKEEEDDMRFKKYARIDQMSVFPGIRHNNKFTIVYAVDTSGSMGTRDLELGLAELQHIQKSDSDVSICVIYADTNITKEYWIGPTDTLDTGLTGRGGTDFELVFERVRDMNRDMEKAPDILVYCTDGYAPPPETRLAIPTVWLLTPRGAPVSSDAGHITIMMKDYQLGDNTNV